MINFLPKVLHFPLRRCQSRGISYRGISYCLLFPGQGSQHVGMGKDLITAAGPNPAVIELFQVAERVLGYDLRPLFLRGPQGRLDETIHCQPAVVVASLAALQAADPKVVTNSKVAAGFSVGEITALIAAGSLSVEQGLQVVKVRAAAMQHACQMAHSSMLTVIGLKEEDLQGIIDSVKESYPDSEVCIGNYLFPAGYVVSGNAEQVRGVASEAERSGAVVKDVRVSGAFHSQLMEPAVADLEAVLRNVDFQIPHFPVYSNVTGLPYANVEEIRKGLALQLTSPVLWETSMFHLVRNFFRSGAGELKFLELGPGKQLKGILKRIDRAAYRSCDSVTV